MPTYSRLDICFKRGEGVWLWNQDNQQFLDALSGIAVCNLGHTHPAVRDAIAEQAGCLLHTSNLYTIDKQEQLATRLTSLSAMDNVFFCNSGAEANEAAIKLARRYGHQQGIEVPNIVVMEQSFHGRTMATLSATGNAKIQNGFEPLLDGFVRVPFNDISAIEALQTDDSIVAVLVEPIQGEGGVNIPAPDYLTKLKELCEKNNWLLMLDEIQTGMGRTGKLFAYQHAEIIPDVCTLAKALGNGVPIGACLAKGQAAEVLSAGMHGSTFGGNPLACAAALAVLETFEIQDLINLAAKTGLSILKHLRDALGEVDDITDIRGQGMMLGIQFKQDCPEFVSKALSMKTLINVTAGNTIRLLPPLIFEPAHTEQLVSTITSLVNNR